MRFLRLLLDNVLLAVLVVLAVLIAHVIAHVVFQYLPRDPQVMASTIGDAIASYESTAAAVAEDQAAVAAANAKLSGDLGANADAATSLRSGLASVGAAAFSPDKSKVYVADGSPVGFATLTPADPATPLS